jgi:hypothetical protein
VAVRRVQETRPALIHAGHDADEDLQAVAHLGRLAVETQGAQIDLPPLPDRITPAVPVLPRAIEAAGDIAPTPRNPSQTAVVEALGELIVLFHLTGFRNHVHFLS